LKVVGDKNRKKNKIHLIFSTFVSLGAITSIFIESFFIGEDATHPCAVACRKTVIKAALERLTSQPELNYGAVAGVRCFSFFILCCLFLSFFRGSYEHYFFPSFQVIRSLLEMCSTDADRLSTLQDAAALISANAHPVSGTAAGTAGYPPLEARYLITAAWNRGATHSKFARMKEAEAFMGVALRILGACSSHENAAENQQQQEVENSDKIGFSVFEKVKHRALACIVVYTCYLTT
jgi:hypothetical protein